MIYCHVIITMEEAKLEMIALYSGITGWINEVRAVNVVFLGFRQAFDTVCRDILIGKLRKVWARCTDGEVDWEQAVWQVSEGCDQWHRV